MDKIIEKINKAQSIAILPHFNEDPDALGSCFAFAEMTRNLGKEAVVYVSGEVENRIGFIGNNYKIYNSEIVPNHDLCVCLDCGDIDRLGERKKLFSQIPLTINIDHHYSNTMFADLNFVDGGSSSTGEILYNLFEKMGISITQEIARLLYIAICSDTGNFRYSNVSPQTMYIAGNLLKYGFDNAEISRKLFECETIEALKLKGEVLQSIESYYDGKLQIVILTDDIRKKYNISDTDVPNLVDIPRKIDGTEVAVCIKEQTNGIRINFRSTKNADVSEVAAKFGGGGHKKAAGCTIIGASVDDIKEKVIQECGHII